MTIARVRAGVIGTLLVVTGAAAACSTTGPTTAAPLTVVLSSPSVVQGHDTTVGGTPSYVCHYRLTATAHGGFDGDVATWGKGHYSYVGQNGAMYSSAIHSGKDSSASLLFTPYTFVPAGGQLSGAEKDVWTEPFQATYVLYYTTVDTTLIDSTSYSYTCQ